MANNTSWADKIKVKKRSNILLRTSQVIKQNDKTK